MIYAFRLDGQKLVRSEGDAALADLPSAVWIDLVTPTPDEETAVERLLDAEIPTREEMAEIEASIRLYMDHGTAIMTAPIVLRGTGPMPSRTDVTFALSPDRLVTVRYDDPTAFRTFANSVSRDTALCSGAGMAFAWLIDTLIERIADVLEATAGDLDALSHASFTEDRRHKDIRSDLQRVGRSGEVVSKARESLVGLARVATFARSLPAIHGDPRAAEKLAAAHEDMEVLLEHATALTTRITFLLDATLGMINIEQNEIIKTFSVVAVVFLPPTLIASLYGMNFRLMPELGWPFGYPAALIAMILSMIAPYLYFKRKGWI